VVVPPRLRPPVEEEGGRHLGARPHDLSVDEAGEPAVHEEGGLTPVSAPRDGGEMLELDRVVDVAHPQELDRLEGGEGSEEDLLRLLLLSLVLV